jgi:hypothetical protein
MRWFAVLVVILSVGCGTDATGDGTSGIEGRVTIGPVCPALQQGSPCPDAPYVATVQVVADGRVVASGRSGDDGVFRVPVAPGTYTVRGIPLDDGGIATARDVPGVTVQAGAFVRADLSFDSGIR